MTSSHPESVLELEGVDVPLSGIPNIRVLRDVNWRVRSGERWMVRGPARSGKSSILSVAAGLVRPVTGRHRLFGKDLADLGESERMARRLKVGGAYRCSSRVSNVAWESTQAPCVTVWCSTTYSGRCTTQYY